MNPSTFLFALATALFAMSSPATAGYIGPDYVDASKDIYRDNRGCRRGDSYACSKLFNVLRDQRYGRRSKDQAYDSLEQNCRRNVSVACELLRGSRRGPKPTVRAPEYDDDY